MNTTPADPPVCMQYETLLGTPITETMTVSSTAARGRLRGAFRSGDGHEQGALVRQPRADVEGDRDSGGQRWMSRFS